MADFSSLKDSCCMSSKPGAENKIIGHNAATIGRHSTGIPQPFQLQHRGRTAL